MPPAFLMASMPRMPSAPVPESTTPIAPGPRSRASEWKNSSTGMFGAGCAGREDRRSTPSAIRSVASGGSTYTRPASTRAPSVALRTSSFVRFARIAGSWLSCPGERCCSSTKPRLVFAGMCSSRRMNASSPPAEAPTATIGQDLASPEGLMAPADGPAAAADADRDRLESGSLWEGASPLTSTPKRSDVVPIRAERGMLGTS